MLPNEMPSLGASIPGSGRLMREVEKAIDYTRMVAAASPGSSAPKDLRDFLRAAALLVPSTKPAATKKD